VRASELLAARWCVCSCVCVRLRDSGNLSEESRKSEDARVSRRMMNHWVHYGPEKMVRPKAPSNQHDRAPQHPMRLTNVPSRYVYVHAFIVMIPPQPHAHNHMGAHEYEPYPASCPVSCPVPCPVLGPITLRYTAVHVFELSTTVADFCMNLCNMYRMNCIWIFSSRTGSAISRSFVCGIVGLLCLIVGAHYCSKSSGVCTIPGGDHSV